MSREVICFVLPSCSLVFESWQSNIKTKYLLQVSAMESWKLEFSHSSYLLFFWGTWYILFKLIPFPFSNWSLALSPPLYFANCSSLNLTDFMQEINRSWRIFVDWNNVQTTEERKWNFVNTIGLKPCVRLSMCSFCNLCCLGTNGVHVKHRVDWWTMEQNFLCSVCGWPCL